MLGFKIAVIRVIAPALVLLAPVLGEARAAEAVNTFKDWTVVCDNLHNCEADGFAVDDVDKPAVLRLTRGGAPGASAKIAIVLLDDTSQVKPGAPLSLVVDERPVLTVPFGDESTATLAAAQVGPLLGAARNGATLSIRQGDDALGVVSLAGMLAALRLVDEQQGRAGTVTAMVAKGPKPQSAVPPQPALPVVHPAPAVAQTDLPAKPPAGVRALAAKAECDNARDLNGSTPEAHRLSASQILWQIPCWSGAYNYSSLFVIVDGKGGARIAPLEGADDGTAVNATYDPKTRILDAYDKGRGVGDCGGSNAWAWTGQAFVLTHAASMPVCRGQADWPTWYQAKVE
jgi:hypothetical protein